MKSIIVRAVRVVLLAWPKARPGVHDESFAGGFGHGWMFYYDRGGGAAAGVYSVSTADNVFEVADNNPSSDPLRRDPNVCSLL